MEINLSKEFIDRIESIELRLKEIERFQEITHRQYQKNITSFKPHVCPLCNGDGRKYIDPNAPLSGFEAMFAPKDEEGRSYRPCRPCDSKGIVWA